MKKLLLTVLSILSLLKIASAQTDNEFWFVAPEATSGHGDQPIVIRMAALSQPSVVTIEQPANLSFVPIVVSIAANSTNTVDLTPYIATIENKPGDVVLNYGIHITATAPITAYYEINTSCSCNPEIFALKGKNAIGTKFFTPFQNFWNNGNYSPTPISAIDIVATQNNTQVTIVPTQNVVGHPAGIPYTITLNKGQTYSAVATSGLAAGHLGGTTVVSNKPIAVTIKDDSVAFGSSYDIMGDQIVPVNIVGDEYIVMKGFLTSNEKVFIAATTNGTTVNVNGSPVATIDTAQIFAYTITNPSTYITSSSPVYVLHATGDGNELASALLPPIVCTGSDSVYFIRSVGGIFGLNVMTKAGNEGNFILNGSNTLVQASSFTAVPGTGGAWMAAQIQFNTTDVPVNASSLITNSTGLFHLGMINGGGGGARYGYFSDFSQINLGADASVCPGDSAIIDAGGGFDTYIWNTGDTTQTIALPNPGTYWVTVSRFGCTATDSVTVVNLPAPILTLNQDTFVCAQTDLVTLNAGTGFDEYLWSTGDTTQTVSVGPGTYIVTVTNTDGCSASSTDSAQITINAPNLILDNDTVICDPNGLVTVDAGPGYISYLWSNGATTQVANLPAGSYTVEVTNTAGCVGVSQGTVDITIQPTIADFINSLDTTVTNIPIQFTDSSQAGTGNIVNWFWDFGNGNTSTDQNPQYAYPDTGLYTVTLLVTNSDGCIDTFTTEILVIELPVVAPNTFSPNGDGINEQLQFAYLEQFAGSKLWIYNRWGNLIYQSNDYKNNWDGGNHTAGVYYFILEVNNMAKQKINGTVTLLK